MAFQPSQEEVDAQQRLLITHRRTLEDYLQKQAQLESAYTPAYISHGIREARDNIRRVKGILQNWRVTVNDHPDDEAIPSEIPQQDSPFTIPQKGISRNRTHNDRTYVLFLCVMVVLLLGLLVWSLYDRTQSLNQVNIERNREITNAYTTQTAQTNIISQLQSTLTAVSTTPVPIASKFTWDGSPLVTTDFSKANAATISYDGSILIFSGKQTGDRIWIKNIDLPKNVNVSFRAKFQHDDCYGLFVGFGNGLFWKPEYRVVLSYNKINFSYLLEQGEETNIVQPVDIYGRDWVDVRVERKDGSVKIYLKNSNIPVFEIPSTSTNISSLDRLNRLFAASVSAREDAWCTVIIDQLTVEEIK